MRRQNSPPLFSRSSPLCPTFLRLHRRPGVFFRLFFCFVAVVILLLLVLVVRLIWFDGREDADFGDLRIRQNPSVGTPLDSHRDFEFVDDSDDSVSFPFRVVVVGVEGDGKRGAGQFSQPEGKARQLLDGFVQIVEQGLASESWGKAKERKIVSVSSCVVNLDDRRWSDCCESDGKIRTMCVVLDAVSVKFGLGSEASSVSSVEWMIRLGERLLLEEDVTETGIAGGSLMFGRDASAELGFEVPFSVQKIVFGGVSSGPYVLVRELWTEFLWWRSSREKKAALSGDVKKWSQRVDVRGSEWRVAFSEFCWQRGLGSLYEIVPEGRGGGFAYDSLYDFSIPLYRVGWEATMSDETILEHEVKLMAHAMQKVRDVGGIPMVTAVNGAFLPMVRSWLCNVNQMNVLNHVVFVCVDPHCWLSLNRDAQSEKTSLRWQTVGLYSRMAAIGGALDFGTVGYYRLMQKRTHFWADVLAAGHSFLSFEVDFFWRKDASAAIFDEGVADTSPIDADLVGMTEDSTVNGGFFLVRATDSGKALFSVVAESFDREIEKFESLPPSSEVQLLNDQLLMTDLLRQWEPKKKIRVSRLSEDVFVSGNHHPKPNDPWPRKMVMLHNNYVIGMDTKITRAKAHGYWFVEDGGDDFRWRCDTIKVQAALA